MFREHFSEVAISRKEFFAIFVLLFNVFTWWSITQIMIHKVLSNLNMTGMQNIIWIAYYATVLGSSLVGSILSDKIEKISFFYLWMIIGVIASLLPVLSVNITTIYVLAICFSLGFSFGLGMPSCLAYFADFTTVENRGRVSGVIFLAINFSAVFAVLFQMFDLTIISMISATWRGLGLITFFLLRPEEKIDVQTGKRRSFISILSDKRFILYLLPWLMFCLVNRLEEPFLRHYLEPAFYDFLGIIESIIVGLFTFIGGMLSDWIGRKRMVIYGFVSLGFAYGVIGIAPSFMYSWYLYGVIDGIAGGIFMVVFILIVWGDLSQAGVREKYYVIGSVPFFLSEIIQIPLTFYIIQIPAYAVFSLSSFFLFVAVLPLMYAPETLPERKIKIRRLRKYVEAARKVKEKHEVKGVKG